MDTIKDTKNDEKNNEKNNTNIVNSSDDIKKNKSEGDLSQILNTSKVDNSDNKYKKHKKYSKPMELTELEHRTSILNKKRRSVPTKSEIVDDIIPFLDKEAKNIYCKTWNKLEKGQRLNRINIFIDDLLKNKLLPEDKCKRLKAIIHNHINNGKLNKNTDVEYCQEGTCILSIKGLTIDEKTKTFKMIIEKSKKTKQSGKSKTNIDRFIRS